MKEDNDVSYPLLFSLSSFGETSHIRAEKSH